jgi:hypothetical protein
MVDDVCAEQELPVSGLGRFTEFSEVEVLEAPDANPPVAQTRLLVVLDVGLMLMHRIGAVDNRIDSRSMMFTEIPGVTFLPEHSLAGPGWGHMEIRASRLSVPLFKLGWPFYIGSFDCREQMTEVARERDRILAAIQRWRPEGPQSARELRH